MNKFERLQVDGWRQYAEIDLPLHPRLTIITGANGAGKSTLLSLFSRHFGFNRSFLSTPIQNKLGIISYSLGIFRWLGRRKPPPEPHQRIIGRIDYTDGAHTLLALSNQQSIAYDVQMPSQQHVVGVHIDSHRPPNMHRHVANIPVVPMTLEAMSGNYTSELRQHYTSGGVNQGTLWHLKAALLNMAIYGYGNATMPAMRQVDLMRYGIDPQQVTVTFDYPQPDVTFRVSSGRDISRDGDGFYHCTPGEWESVRSFNEVKLVDDFQSGSNSIS